MNESMQTVGYLVLGLATCAIAVALFYFGALDQSTTLPIKCIAGICGIFLVYPGMMGLRTFFNRLTGGSYRR
jgi:hypothetical protein